ncbi:MAG: ScpA family protein [Rhodospirillales bacterium]|jgi:segregation and condensation protein A|nr:ScpA family protein [Rhodospirillales bacterium]HIJ43045.1 segregation/condensation protein A [Rhodospirillaceae bacterium]MDP7216240.1 ScpA family protein [Rhodospirillales bacterium]HIJ44615.1 segregation/condensation protein A [Rhodospirillaceae bacterium]HIJ92153.1 segregation/condensation protein A [Rhodospirillaceae bacterium]
MARDDVFEETPAPAGETPALPFVVDIDGFEGPIDMLLALAREQKVDLAHISILQLADQYLAFIVEIRRADLELAADYLVMAAWLAYLKSRLLLPDLGEEDEPTGEEMAAALAFQLRRLEGMREAGTRLMAGSRLGREFFARGAPEAFAARTKTVLEATLYDLLKAYGEQKLRQTDKVLHIEPWELYTVEEALRRLRLLLGKTPEWTILSRFLPPVLGDRMAVRSALAATLAAALEMAREGKLKLRQSAPFGPIYLHRARAKRSTGKPEPNG